MPSHAENNEHGTAHGDAAVEHGAIQAGHAQAGGHDAHAGDGNVLKHPHPTFLNAYPVTLEALAGRFTGGETFGERFTIAGQRVGSHEMSPVPGTVLQWVSVSTLASWFVIFGLLFLMHRGVRRMTNVPGRLQGILEWTWQTFDGFARNAIGREQGSRFAPLLATFFIYILFLNLGGLIPGFMSPTAGLSITVALALCCFVAVQYFGIRAQGLSYFKHFIGEPLWMAPINLPIHILGELARPLSLSIRLFGNIFGEDTVIGRLIAMGVIAIGTGSVFIPIPFQFPMLLFGIFGAFVQALVFTMLSASYLASAVETHH